MRILFTYTCNQSKHIGTTVIKNQINSKKWEEFYQNFKEFFESEKKEIRKVMDQSVAPLLLHNQMEVRKLFLEYIYNTPGCLFTHTHAMFARGKHQLEVGNLPHIHTMICIKLKELNEEQRKKSMI